MTRLSDGSTHVRVDAFVLPPESAVALRLDYYYEIASEDKIENIDLTFNIRKC